MAMNPLAPTMAPLGMGSPVPGMNVQPYPQLGPAQGGSMAPDQGMPGGEEARDRIADLAKFATMFQLGPQEMRGAMIGAGLPSLLRMIKPAEPRGVTDNPATGPGGAPTGPPPIGPPAPPSMGGMM